MNPADIDRTVKPGDDFFAYVNGKWSRSEAIPPQYPYSGVSLALVLGAEQAVKHYHAILSKKGLTPKHKLEDDLKITEPALEGFKK